MRNELRLVDRFIFPQMNAWLRVDTDEKPAAVAKKVGKALGVELLREAPDEDCAVSFSSQVLGHRVQLYGVKSLPTEGYPSLWQIVLEVRPAAAPDPESQSYPVYIYIADFLAGLIEAKTRLKFTPAIKAG